jgi:hypothetical protein
VNERTPLVKERTTQVHASGPRVAPAWSKSNHTVALRRMLFDNHTPAPMHLCVTHPHFHHLPAARASWA